MTAAQRFSFFSDMPLGKVGQASVAIIICGSALLFLVAILWGTSSSIFSKAHALSVRASNIENLESRLLARREELTKYLNLTGLSANQAETGTDANSTSKLLIESANSLSETMEQHGFVVASQSGPSENAISSALSSYQSQLRFAGSLDDLSNFLAYESDAIGYASDLTINGNSNIDDDHSHIVSIKLRQIGPKSESSGNEPNE